MAAAGFRWCNRVPPGGDIVLAIAGASNSRGNNAATGDPALAGFTLPAGVALYEGTTDLLVSYPTDHHGPEVGIIDELVNVRGIDPARITIVKHGVPGSSLTAWGTTYHAELDTILATAGRAHGYLMVQGAADAGDSSAAAAYGANMLVSVGRFRRFPPGAGTPVCWALMRTDIDKEFAADVLAAQIAFELVCQGLRTMDVSDLPNTPDEEDDHFTGLAVRTIGRRFVDQLFEDEVITT